MHSRTIDLECVGSSLDYNTTTKESAGIILSRTESTGVVVADGLGVPEGFQNRGTLHQDVLHALRRSVGHKVLGSHA